MSTEDDQAFETDPAQDEPMRAGVRWKRFAGMLGITGAMAAGLVVLSAQGVLASAFSISGMPFTVTADRLYGTGFEQFATIDPLIENSPLGTKNGDQQLVIVSAIDQADLTKLCQSVDMGGVFLKITAGDTKDHVTGKTLVVDSDLVSGDATFNEIKIGQDSSTFDGSDLLPSNELPDGGKQVDRVPGVNGFPGVFGQNAKTVEILNLRQNNYATTAAVFKLPHLRMTFTEDDC